MSKVDWEKRSRLERRVPLRERQKISTGSPQRVLYVRVKLARLKQEFLDRQRERERKAGL
jgi:uncharacterized lipoprotein